MRLLPDGRNRPVALVATLYADVLDAFKSMRPTAPAVRASHHVEDIRRGRPASVERILLGIDEQLAHGGSADAAREVGRRLQRAIDLLITRHQTPGTPPRRRPIPVLEAVERELHAERAGATTIARVLAGPADLDTLNAAIAAGMAEIHATAALVQALEARKQQVLSAHGVVA